MTIGTGINRIWAPNVGSLCKMREWADYASRKITMWAWLKVLSVDADSRMVQVQHSNAGNLEGEPFFVPLDRISRPIGWEPVATIYADAAGIEKIRAWRDFGVNVWTSADLSTAGRMTYTRGDCNDKPHWSMELVEHIPPHQMADCVRLVRVDTEYCGKPDAKTRREEENHGWKYHYCRRSFLWSRRREVAVSFG